jgi:rfaE bifunctional protein kinase chain/domain
MESVDHNLGKLSSVRVLVVGDVMLDQYWKGDVRRISPEAPVPVIVVSDTEERIGGAGNVARNITSLQGKCTLLGIIGKDEAGRSITRIAGESGVNAILEMDSGIKTTIKLRVLSRNQQLLRADFENDPGEGVLQRLFAHYRNLVNEHDVVIFSDYGKGSLSRIEVLIEIAVSSGKAVFVDPKGRDYTRYQGATMVTPNLSEFESVMGTVNNEDELATKAGELIQTTGISQLLVTLSDKGMKLFGENGETVHIAARSREVYDVSGAGDTVIAVMAMAISAGFPNQLAMELANSAAGVVISKLGTATVNLEELAAAVQEDYQS